MKLIQSYYTLSARILISLALIAGLSGCANLLQGPATQSPFQQSPDAYLAQANAAQDATRQPLLLQATAAYFYYGNYSAGRKALYQVTLGQLDSIDFAQYQLLATRLALYDNQAERALGTLNGLVDNPNLTPAMQVEALQLRASAQQALGLPLASVKTHLLLEPLLNDTPAQPRNQQQLWAVLQTIPAAQLTPLSIDTSQPVLQGWASLALMSQTFKTKPQQLVQQLQQWLSQYPEHPAQNLVQNDIKRINMLLNVPQQVALLLPLQGPTGPQAQAVMNGFMAAYYRAQQQGWPTPQVKFYNTYNQDINDVYQKAVAAGARFVIGPLTKEAVNQLASDGNVTVPTLALNFGSDVSLPSKLYEFALSPVSEAQAAANRVTQLGYQNVVILSPDSTWGQNIAAAFATQWTTNGGKVLANVAFATPNTLKSTVARLLGISDSYARQRALQKLLRQPLKFSPRRRADVDAIFLNATPNVARQIIPLLRFYYAGNIPVFATSQIYGGLPNASGDNDLNGVQFTIMPWAIKPSAQALALRSDIKKLWPQSFKQFSLLYGFGVDTYAIMTELPRLSASPQLPLAANTGELTLQNNRIHRQTEWAKFVKGQPRLLSTQQNTIAPLADANT
jgi:outer membrane PBP1 activator LpoA protein